MPTYEYKCENGHPFEVTQRMADDPIAACQECGAPVERVFHPVAVHFKGSGFYTTDYAKKKETGERGADSKSDSKGAKESGSGEKASKSDSSAKAASGSD